jgi:hypothetical protein
LVWSFIYLALRRVLGLLVLRGRSQRSKDLELVVLRHEVQILRRQVRRLELQPADRGFLAACGVRQLNHAADLGITGRLATPQWALPRLGECVLRLVQRMGFAAELEDATRPRTRPCRTAGQGRAKF